MSLTFERLHNFSNVIVVKTSVEHFPVVRSYARVVRIGASDVQVDVVQLFLEVIGSFGDVLTVQMELVEALTGILVSFLSVVSKQFHIEVFGIGSRFRSTVSKLDEFFTISRVHVLVGPSLLIKTFGKVLVGILHLNVVLPRR